MLTIPVAAATGIAMAEQNRETEPIIVTLMLDGKVLARTITIPNQVIREEA